MDGWTFLMTDILLLKLPWSQIAVYLTVSKTDPLILKLSTAVYLQSAKHIVQI